MSDLVLKAISFAARAHRHQLRKDGMTPYISHPMRVMFIARDLFGVTDPKILAAAVLHDTIEDTTIDYDDLKEQFGEEVATWVAALTKDTRLPEDERERVYGEALISGGNPVIFCKLADMYDNLKDSSNLSPAAQHKTLARVRYYLDQIKPGTRNDSETACQIVEQALKDIHLGLVTDLAMV